MPASSRVEAAPTISSRFCAPNESFGTWGSPSNRTGTLPRPWCARISFTPTSSNWTSGGALERHAAGSDRGEALKETQHHFRYSSGWPVRLGDGTEQAVDAPSRRSINHGLTRASPSTSNRRIGRCKLRAWRPDLAAIESHWAVRAHEVLHQATFARPANGPFRWYGVAAYTLSNWAICSPNAGPGKALIRGPSGSNAAGLAAAESTAWAALAAVMDPEIPALSVVDLGLIRDVKRSDDGQIEVGPVRRVPAARRRR